MCCVARAVAHARHSFQRSCSCRWPLAHPSCHVDAALCESQQPLTCAHAVRRAASACWRSSAPSWTAASPTPTQPTGTDARCSHTWAASTCAPWVHPAPAPSGCGAALPCLRTDSGGGAPRQPAPSCSQRCAAQRQSAAGTTLWVLHSQDCALLRGRWATRAPTA